MSDLVQLRKITMHFDEIYHEGGPAPAKPLVRAAILAVARNPYAGGYVEDLTPYMEALGPLGTDLARRLLEALGGKPAAIEGYGKGAIVGAAGEIEHGALWHAPGGYAMRDVLGSAKAIVPSTKKVGALGSRLDVPITHVNASKRIAATAPKSLSTYRPTSRAPAAIAARAWRNVTRKSTANPPRPSDRATSSCAGSTRARAAIVVSSTSG